MLQKNARAMKKTLKSREREQTLPIPPCLPGRVPQAHPSHCMVNAVAQLDLSAMYNSNGGDGRDPPLYDPEMIASLPFHAYCLAAVSSRKIEKRIHEDTSFHTIAAMRHPDHDSICALGKRRIQASAAFLIQILKLCPETELVVPRGHVAPVGPKTGVNSRQRCAAGF